MNEEDPLILFLYNVESKILHGEATDLLAIQETANIAVQLIEALRSRNYRILPIQVYDSLKELRKNLKPFSPETAFVFNYCDTFAGNNMAAMKIARLLEEMGFKHTGSTADIIASCINKSHTKRLLIANGLSTPRYQVFAKPTGSYRFSFPAIVKPVADDGSVGITLGSVVETQEELLQRVHYLLNRYRQNALVEEFIQGREMAVSLWGNGANVKVLPITEQDYALIPDPLSQILTYESKWNPESPEYKNVVVRCPADLDPETRSRVTDTALRTYRAVGLRDFGRVDIRYRDGVPYVIDINEIPDLAPGEGFVKAAQAAGYGYEDMVEQILKFAMQREDWKWQKPSSKLASRQLKTAKASLD